MRKIQSVIAVAAVAAGMLASPLASGTADASTYTLSYINRCAVIQQYDCFQLGAYSTKTNSQIWINGNVICHPYAGTVHITWCGVGGGNGTGALNIGDNFTFPGATGSYYERMDIFAGPDQVCDTWGSNADGNGIQYWANAALVCESPA
jgi:hypothetical protein